jgi:hypothetical protein
MLKMTASAHYDRRAGGVNFCLALAYCPEPTVYPTGGSSGSSEAQGRWGVSRTSVLLRCVTSRAPV